MPLGVSVKFEAPEILKPEVPGINTLQKMTKHEPVTVIKMGEGGKNISITDMMREGRWLFDDLKKIYYMINHDSIKLRLLMADGKPTTKEAYMVDDRTASTIEIELPEVIKTMKKPVTIKALDIDGTEIKCGFDADVPEKIKTYTGKGSTISLIPAEYNNQWYGPGPEAWDYFIENKGIKDMFPASINPGWFAVLFVIAFTFGGFICGIGGIFLGKLLLG